MTRSGGQEVDEGHRAGRTQTIGRALAVLEVVRDAASDIGIVQIADTLGLSPSTAHRIAGALVRGGYLAHNPESGRYYLGRSSVLLGLAAERNLGLDAALPALERLGAQTAESVNLGVREGMSGLVVMRVLSPQPLRFDQRPGTKAPLYASAMGKCLLAFAGDVDGYLATIGNELARLTSTTITSVRALRKELATTTERGYSFDDEESIPGLRCVGAPVLDTHGRIRAAVAVQAPAARMPDARMAELAALVTATAKEVAEVLPVDRRL